MNNLRIENTIDSPISRIHVCPICKHICPECKEKEKDFFFYWMNYRPLLEKEKVYENDECLALALNDEYAYGAFRAGDGSWDYNLFDECGTLLDSGQIGDEWFSFVDVLSWALEQNNITVNKYEEIPWVAFNCILEIKG